MNNKVLSLIIVLALVVVGVLLFMGRSSAPVELNIPSGTEPTNEVSENEPAGDEESNVVEISIDASNFKFSEDSITVNKGDTVRITLTNTQGVHDLRIEGYDVGTQVINAGQSETMEFVATNSGTFEYYCSVGTHRQMGMVGTLTVN